MDDEQHVYEYNYIDPYVMGFFIGIPVVSQMACTQYILEPSLCTGVETLWEVRVDLDGTKYIRDRIENSDWREYDPNKDTDPVLAEVFEY